MSPPRTGAPIRQHAEPPAADSALSSLADTTFSLDIEKSLRTATRHFELGVRLRTTARRVVIHGPSGSGKSLTLQAIAGLLRPDRGRIALCGRRLFDDSLGIELSAREREIGYLFQDYALFPHLTVRQNVNFGLTRSLLNPLRRRKHPQSEYWLSALGIDDLAGHYPWQLSGGQRQRTALARALARRPRALLLDEPFAALDPALRARLRDELDALQRRLDIPLVLVTHDQADIERFGDAVFEIRDGRVSLPGRRECKADMRRA
ncbi:MAG: ATP-binding cassette domain-containing protein [Burkholderiaceae bacterium]|nr:ATP-binding cassette domain-containing protein [Burkholderiaceae bacterium]